MIAWQRKASLTEICTSWSELLPEISCKHVLVASGSNQYLQETMSTTKWRWILQSFTFVNHEPNETSMYGSCEEFSSKTLLTPLNLLQGVFHIRKLPVANLTKCEFSSKISYRYIVRLVVLMCSWYRIS